MNNLMKNVPTLFALFSIVTFILVIIMMFAGVI